MWFLEELKKLQLSQPRIALVSSDSENSAYTNYAYKNKNCYLVFGGHYNEDDLYTQYCYANKNCVDCDKVERSELAYECSFCSKLYNCSYLLNSFSCSDTDFGYDLVNCRNCFLSAGLRTAEYHILNKPYTKEEYSKEVARMKKQYSTRELWAKLEEIRRTIPHVGWIQKNCEESMGSYLENCKGCYFCFNGTDLEDCIYMTTNGNYCKNSVDCDCIGYDPCELLYECVGNSGNYNCNFCNACWHNSDLEYCEMVFNSKNCFGCVSRNHAEYEILNVKYSKDDYFNKVAEIKDELRKANLYGKWLIEPTHPYEDTVAQLYFPK